MANQIASIQVLDDILKNRYHDTPNGRVQIGSFWSILQIYHCIKVIGVSPRIMCEIASMVEGRIDHNYMPTSEQINTNTLRRWLHLKTAPKNIGHSTITKTVAKGYADMDKLKAVLMKNNSFGDSIMQELQEVMESGASTLLSSSSSTQGASNFNAVLSVALAIIDVHRNGQLSLDDVLPNDVMDVIIQAIINNNNNKHASSRIGIKL